MCVILLLIDNEDEAATMQVAVAQTGVGIGHVDARPGAGGIELQRVNEADAAAQLGDQFHARHGVGGHGILQEKFARAI